MAHPVDPIPFPEGFDRSFPAIVDRLLASLLATGLVTDDHPGSVSRMLAETFARELATAYEVLSRAHAAGYLETAEGPALDEVVALLGLERSRAGHLTGRVLFRRSSPAPEDIPLPAGLRVTGVGQDRKKPMPLLELIETTALPKGETKVFAAVQEVPGQDSSAWPNLGAHTVTLLPRPVWGIDAVSNPDPITRASLEETDDALRARARGTMRAGERSTGEAIAVAAREQGVSQVTVIEPADGPAGYVILRLADPGLERDPDRLEAVKAAVSRAKAAGVRVKTEILRDVFVVPAIELEPVDPKLDDASWATLRAGRMRAIGTYLQSLAPGTAVSSRKLEAIGLADDRVAEARLVSIQLFPLDYAKDRQGVPQPDQAKARALTDGTGWSIEPLERATVDLERFPPLVKRAGKKRTA